MEEIKIRRTAMNCEQIASKLVNGFLDYETKVRNRVAHSIGCHPSDIDAEQILDCFLANLSQFNAANAIEAGLYRPTLETQLADVDSTDCPF